MGKVYVFDHPLIQHKLSILRDKNTGTREFRQLIAELAMLECYEATRDLPLQPKLIQTPIGPCNANELAGRKMAIIPILRAGLGMVDGILNLVPSAKVGHIGMFRDPETHAPVPYYCKLPHDVEERDVLVLDPMLATGGSAVDAINQVKTYNPKSIRFLCIVAAPEGLQALQAAHPDVDIICAALDEKLNENAYIVPGLGDAGDRIFGTL